MEKRIIYLPSQYLELLIILKLVIQIVTTSLYLRSHRSKPSNFFNHRENLFFRYLYYRTGHFMLGCDRLYGHETWGMYKAEPVLMAVSR